MTHAVILSGPITIQRDLDLTNASVWYCPVNRQALEALHRVENKPCRGCNFDTRDIDIRLALIRAGEIKRHLRKRSLLERDLCP